MNVTNFIKNHTCLTYGTLGLAVLGYIGYRTVIWVKNHCCKTQKVAQVSSSLGQANHPMPQSAKTFKAEWIRLTDKTERENEAKKLEGIFKSLASPLYAKAPHQPLPEIQSEYKLPAGKVSNIPGNFGLWMPGVAFIATEIQKKKGLEGLYVCDTLEAFASRLKQIADNPGDERCAFIIPTRGSSSFKPNFPQHKVAVFVEKKASQLSIALMDAQPDSGNDTINPDHVKIKKGLWAFPYNPQELAYKAILKACGNTDARLMYSQVVREKHYGCETYALQDAITFLQDPEFFEKVTASIPPVKLNNGKEIEIITELPADYLVGIQSQQFYDDLRQIKGEDFFNQPLIGRKKTLQQHLDTYLVPSQNTMQNHYITKKSYGYLNKVMEGMINLNNAQFNAVVGETLVTTVDPTLFPKVGYYPGPIPL